MGRNSHVQQEGESSMDHEQRNVVSTSESETAGQAALDATSGPFVGRWNHLVSSTNWEKGRIIYQWRAALVDAGVPSTECSDEAWSRRVGGVTGQHVGRLRRVYQRFGQSHEEYPGLYWSHFQAALDWDDAEMWLEGAVQSRWSVSQMRHQRWESMGAVAEAQPQQDEVVASELDEDFEPAPNQPPSQSAPQPDANATGDIEVGPREEGPDFAGNDHEPTTTSPPDPGAAVYADEQDGSTAEFVRPFADLKTLPDDLAEAFEAFKLAILNHKMNQWNEISREDVLASLEALRKLVMAPSEQA
ncbi:MAG: hypothetical protein ACODAD_10640 [Planctomycetota bacterium]